MTKGGVRIALKLMLIDLLTAQRPETVILMYYESISIPSELMLNDSFILDFIERGENLRFEIHFHR